MSNRTLRKVKAAPATCRLNAPREEVRQALLDAADTMIRRYGYRKTSMEEIAQKANVCRATAYLYFANKEALVMAWVARQDERRCERLTAIAGGGGKVMKRLATLLLTRILERFDSAQSLKPGLDELLSALRVPLLNHREQHYANEAKIVEALLREAVAAGEIRCKDLLGSARLLILATNALMPTNLNARQLADRDEIESQARDLIALLLAGLCVQGTSAKARR